MFADCNTTKPISAREQARRTRFRSFMWAYYSAREADLLAMEYVTCGYETEIAEYIETHGRPMYFKKWLIESRGQSR